MKVAFCPMQDMVADFFTKPLQGNLFVCMHERILNLPTSKIANMHRSVLEQCGVNSDKTRKTKKNDGSTIVDKTHADKTHWQESEYDEEWK